MRVLDGKNGWLTQIVISSDNKRIVASDSKGNGIRQFDLSDGTLRIGYRHRHFAVGFFPDSDHILIAVEDLLLNYDWETGSRFDNDPRYLREDPPEAQASGVYQMLTNPAGELVTLGMDAGYDDFLVSRWKVAKGGDLKLISESKLESSEYVYVALSPDGSKLIAVFDERSPRAGGAVILSVPRFKELGAFETPINSTKLQLLMSPAGNQIVAREEGKSFLVWDGPDWETRREVKLSGRRMLTGLAYHPSGQRLAAACNDETVRVFDTASWEEVSNFTWKSGRLRSVAYSADGTLAAAGSDTGKVIVWDVDE